MNDHIFAALGNGRKIIYMSREQADRLVADGAACWTGKRKIKFNTTTSEHGIAAIPEFSEQMRDTAHWVAGTAFGRHAKSHSPTLTEPKRNLVKAMKQL